MERGSSSARVMLVGLGPGRSATTRKLAFAGNSFTNLKHWFRDAGFDLTEDRLRSLLYMTSLIKCAAHPDSASNRRTLWSRCRDHLQAQFCEIKPDLVLLLGKETISGLSPRLGNLAARDQVGMILDTTELFRGDLFPVTQHSCTWILMPHPSGLSRTLNEPGVRQKMTHALRVELTNLNFAHS